MDSGPRITGISFVLAVPDLDATARWWVETMGFELVLEIDGWAFVQADDCLIRLGECPGALPPAAIGDHQYFGYIEIEGVDAYHDEIADAGAEILFEPVDRPWGMREMAVRTPDGHRVMFAEPVAAPRRRRDGRGRR